MFKFPVFQLHVACEPKLLPGRKPIIQIAERSIHSKTRLKVATAESSTVTKSSGNHNMVIPVTDYTIPQTMSECDSISRTIRRKGMWDFRREIAAYADPI